jgi:4,4'-diaponeurosporenoate glycosyltransferase
MDSLWVLFIAASCVYGIAGTLMLWRIPRCSKQNSPPASVSVIIPARNEEKRLPALLRSLKRELETCDGNTRFDVVVVDDRSDDATAEIARSFGTRVVSVPLEQEIVGKPGKSRACWTGVKETGGDFLLFLDADTWFEPGGLERIIGTWQGGLLSVQPYHDQRSFYETFSAYFNIVVMAGVNAFTPFSKKGRPLGSFGPCLYCSREEYHLAGGHKAIEEELVDDIALARLFKKKELPVSCYGGRGSISFRMYAEGFSGLIEGWTKNMATGARFSSPVVSILLFVWIAGVTNLFLGIGKTVELGTAYAVAGAAAVYLLYVFQMAVHLRRIGSFPFYTALFFPVYLLFFIGIFFYSLFRTKVVKKVRWRGRELHL